PANAEVRQAAIPLHTPDMVISRFLLADINNVDARGVGGGQTGDAIGARTIVQRTREDRSVGRIGAAVRGSLSDRNPVVLEDRNSTVGRNNSPRGKLHGFLNLSATQVTQQVVIGSPGALIHREIINQAVLVRDKINHGIKRGERKRIASRSAGGSDHLTRINEIEQAEELIADASAVDKLVLVLTTNALGLGGDLHSRLIVPVAAASGLDQAVDFRIADNRDEARSDTRKGCRVLGDNEVARGRVLHIRKRKFAVILQRITLDAVKADHFKEAIDSDDRLNDTGYQFIEGQLGRLVQGNRGHL